MPKALRKPVYRRWRCPRCKNTFVNALPVLEVYCNRQYHGKSKDPVRMVPDEEPKE